MYHLEGQECYEQKRVRYESECLTFSLTIEYMVRSVLNVR